MKRNQLRDVAVFVEVARARGFRAAAEHLDLRASSISDAVQRFEERLGVKLFERSTRSVALTPIGERLYRRSLPALRDLEAALRELDEHRDEVSGTLRLSAPFASGELFLDGLVAEFARQYPAVDVELVYDDRKVDLIESGVDATIRSQALLEPETHAIRVGPAIAMSVVASPAYVERTGLPESPRDLPAHDGIHFAFGSAERVAPWTFQGPDGAYAIAPKKRIVANDLGSLVRLAEAGLGLAYVYRRSAAHSIAQGRLVEVLREHVVPLPPYSLNYRSKRLMTRRLRAFIELAKSNAHSAAR